MWLFVSLRTHEHRKLHCTGSDPWSIKVSIVYPDSRVSESLSYHLRPHPMTGVAGDWTWDLLHVYQMLYRWAVTPPFSSVPEGAFKQVAWSIATVMTQIIWCMCAWAFRSRMGNACVHVKCNMNLKSHNLKRLQHFLQIRTPELGMDWLRAGWSK